MKLKIIILSFFLVFELLSIGQNNKYFIGFKDTTKKEVTIDFKLINNLIVIPLQINKSDTLSFILDTGIRPTLLTNLTDSIGFKVGKSQKIRGLGTGDDLTVYHTYANVIEIAGEIVLTLQNVFILDEDKFELSKKMGTTINGIIGNSVFENFIVQIDYDRKEITFHDPNKFKLRFKHRRYIKIPLTIYNGKPYAKIRIGINKDTTILSDVLIDLGASDALWLLPGSNDSIPKNLDQKKYYLGQGLNGDIFGYQDKVKYVFLEKKYVLKDVTVSYPDTSSIKVGENYDIPGRSGTIGSEIIRRFDVIIDYQNKQMLLKKNSSFRDEFNFDLSGLEIEAPYPGLNYYTIYKVHKKSPASEAGFKKGDQILRVNYVPTTKMKLNEILNILNSRTGRKIRFLIKRDSVELKKKIVLRDYRTQ